MPEQSTPLRQWLDGMYFNAPSDWTVGSLRFYTSTITQGPNPDYSMGIPDDKHRVLKTKDLYDDVIHYTSTDRISPETFRAENKSRLRPGDVLVAIVGKGSIGKTNIFEPTDSSQYIFSRAIGLIRPAQDRLSPVFLKYFLQSGIGKELLDFGIDGSTGQEIIKTTYLKGLRLLLPPLPEQRAIADFLDRKTGAIDDLIAKKERLIELLNEKRQAVITQAVTKGLDPSVPMKDSGIPAVGQIPVHWNVERTRWVFREVKDRSETGEEELLTVSHLTGVTPRAEKTVYMFKAESLEGYKKCEMHDLVINTMWAWMGALGIAKCAGVVSPSYNVYRLRTQEFDPEYLDLLYRTPPYICEINRFSEGVWKSRLRLYPGSFFQMQTLAPPVSEQRSIVKHINNETGQTESFSVKLAESTEKLREYRQALISAAVTGKIDVRSEVAS